jgi:pimeloyl-ACP methyl ester carboxylesterase
MTAIARARSSPKAAAAAEAFVTPPRQRTETWAEAQLGDLFWVEGLSGRIAVRRHGKGPQVLLVHGWGGIGGDLAWFVQPLAAAGFRTLTADLPAHGQSDGDAMSIPQAAKALLEVERAVGHLHAVIAHSMGAAITVEAMGIGLNPDGVVLIGAPAHYINHAHAVAAQAGLDADAFEEMLAILKVHGIDVRDISTPKIAEHLTTPALFVHSTDDQVVPIADAIEASTAWRRSQLVSVQHLGHRRVLKAPSVINAAVTFCSHLGRTQSDKASSTHRA